MLRSWISRIAKGAPMTAGIAIGGSQVCLAALDPRSRAMRFAQSQNLPRPLFAAEPTSDDEAALSEVLRSLCREMLGDYVHWHLALPDMVVRAAVLELDELPKGESMRNELLRWRLAKEFARSEDSLACRGLFVGKERGKAMLFAQALDRRWLECIERAAQRAGVVPSSINGASVFRFNRFYDLIAKTEGVLVSLDPDSWTLLAWDSLGQIRFARSRARAADFAPALLVDEIERTILAYVHGEEGRQVRHVYVAGIDCEAIGSALDPRLHQPAIRLDARRGIAGDASAVGDSWSHLAFAAAVNA